MNEAKDSLPTEQQEASLDALEMNILGENVTELVKKRKREGVEILEGLHERGQNAAGQIAREFGADVPEAVKQQLAHIQEQSHSSYETLRQELSPVIEQAFEDHVQHEVLDAYREYHTLGPKVGEAVVKNRKTGALVPVEVRVQRSGRDGLEFVLSDGENRKNAYVELKGYTPETLQDLPDHSPLVHYGNGAEKDLRPRVYVNIMESKGNWEYAGLGKVLHQIAVERSFQIGGEGRVQLVIGGIAGSWMERETPGKSGGFHENFGFVGQDVYNPDGSLHHSGQSVNERLAESRWRTAQYRKELASYQDSPEKAARFWPPREEIQSEAEFYSEDRAYMYLPEDVIERERKRILEHPILQVNRATLEALLQKHEVLKEQSYFLAQARSLEQELASGEHAAQESVWYKRLAKLYEEGGDVTKAREYYLAVAERKRKELEQGADRNFNDVTEAAELYDKSGRRKQAVEYFEQAGKLAEERPDTAVYALIYYKHAGNAEKVRQLSEPGREQEHMESMVAERANYQGHWDEVLMDRLRDEHIKRQFIEQRQKYAEGLPERDPANAFQKVTKTSEYYHEQIEQYDAAVEKAFRYVEVLPALEKGKKAENLGSGRYGEYATLFRDAVTKEGMVLTERQKNILLAHELGHAVRDYQGGDIEDITRALDFGRLSQGDKNYFRKAEEIIERMAQLKNYFGMQGSEVFTKEHLAYAREHYIKDTGFDNNMSGFFEAITNESEADFLRIINSYGV